MKSTKPTISIIQKSHKATDGTQEVRIRVRFRTGPDTSFPTGVSLTADDYHKVFTKKNIRSVDHRAAHVKVTAMYNEALKLADQNGVTLDMFELLFKGQGGDLNCLQDALTLVIKQRKERSERERKTYGTDSHTTIKNFLDREYGHKVFFTEVTKEWLEDFDTRLSAPKAIIENGKTIGYKDGVSINTINRYHNVLRAVFNLAIYTWKTVSPSLYPYGKGGFVVQKLEKDNENLLRDDDWAKWRAYVPTNDKEKTAMDFWFLSYYLVGVNFKDIFTYRRSQLTADLSKVNYIRSKSATSKRVVKKVSKDIHPIAQEIIRRHMDKTLNPNAYLFPLVNDGMAYQSIVSRIKRFTYENNKVTKAIAAKLGISVPVRSYTARHTAADTLWSNGATDPQVMELLDHRDPRTTQKYKHNMRNSTQQQLIMGL